MKRLRPFDNTTLQSTRYQDQKEMGTLKERGELDKLQRNIRIEIELASGSILKLEALQNNYFEDALLSKSDSRIGYHMRYVDAYERLNMMVNARYAPFRPVLNDGKQNV